MSEASQMISIPGGTFRMGSVDFYAEEGPVHERTVAPFELDLHPVTNEQFAAFVAATGYVTVAERPLDPADFPGADISDFSPGGLVFTPTPGPVDLRDWRQWWAWGEGASWRRPFGAGSSIEGRERHPVVQVSFEDANAYAAWAGKRLPSEVEWEFAARGGLDGATYAWGEELRPDGVLMADTWQGSFPYDNTGAAGWVGTAPVGSFAPNGYGLFDCIGNVWEWTSDFYSARHVLPAAVRPNLLAGPSTGRLPLRMPEAAAATRAAAVRATRAAPPPPSWRRPRHPPSPAPRSPAACSRAAPTSALRSTACATARRPAPRRPRTRRRPTSVSGARVRRTRSVLLSARKAAALRQHPRWLEDSRRNECAAPEVDRAASCAGADR